MERRDVQLHHSWTCRAFIRHRHRPERLFQRLQRRGHPQPAAHLHHHRRFLSLCEGESSELCTPLVAGNTYEWSTGETSNCITVDMRAFIRSLSPTRTVVGSVCSEEIILNPLPQCTITGDFSSAKANPASFAPLVVVGNTYEWSTGETSNCITVDMPGIYSVTVTGPNGCFQRFAAKRSSSTAAAMHHHRGFLSLRGANPASFAPSGCRQRPTAPIDWRTQWARMEGETSNCITVDMPGIYSVTVTDPNGCFSASAAKVIILNPLPQCTITGDFSSAKVNPASFCTLVVGNTYEWSTGETSNCITVDMPGHLFCTVTDPERLFSARLTKKSPSTRCLCTHHRRFSLCEANPANFAPLWL